MNERILSGRKVLSAEIAALERMADGLDGAFAEAVERVLKCEGAVLCGGVGKAGIIARKFSASLASLGTPSHFLNPAEALHGDLGRVRRGDAVVLFSLSGETEEIKRILPVFEEQGNVVIAVTGNRAGTLAKKAAVVLDICFTCEAGELGHAPTSSTLAMLALADALALVVSQERRFADEDFAKFHPAGALGLKLSRVDDYMRPIGQCRVAAETETVRSVFLALQRPGRRTGAIMLTASDGKLSGFFTDSDLSRLFERGMESAFDGPISAVMTRNPISVRSGIFMEQGVELMAQRKISELPVVDEAGKPVGMLDVTDVIGLFPQLNSF